MAKSASRSEAMKKAWAKRRAEGTTGRKRKTKKKVGRKKKAAGRKKGGRRKKAGRPKGSKNRASGGSLANMTMAQLAAQFDAIKAELQRRLA